MQSEHETIEVKRDGRVLLGATDIIFSPDDGGWYFSEADFQKRRGRMSAKVYKTAAAAKKLWAAGKVEWEEWR